MFNIGDEVVAKRRAFGINSEYEGVVIDADEAARIVSGSSNPSIYGSLSNTIKNMMRGGEIFIRTEEILYGTPQISVRWFAPRELTHKVVTKEYDPSQNGDTDEDV